MSKKKSPDKKVITENPELSDQAPGDPVLTTEASTSKDEPTLYNDADPAVAADKPATEKEKTLNKESTTKPSVKVEAEKPAAKPAAATKPKKSSGAGSSFPVLGLLNLVLIIGMAGAGAWYWQSQQVLEQGKQEAMLALQQQLTQQLSTKADQSTADQIQQRLQPLESVIGDSAKQIGDLQTQQQSLLESTEKLYELYGRDENGWQLAEVEYLMRVAQHKLILENDFEGAATTLQAASDKIAATADPGLLPVRVQISDEIAGLKTRSRPDLVGMTLQLSQLSKQIGSLKPGYEPRIDPSTGDVKAPTVDPSTLSLEDRVVAFFDSLVTVNKSEATPAHIETLTIDVEEVMENNLKLTRWTVLERDAFQYQRLMDENVGLFKQYYDLDNAANYDFYSQLLALQKSQIKPEKPNISGSLEMLRHIISRRQQAPSDDLEAEAGDV